MTRFATAPSKSSPASASRRSIGRAQDLQLLARGGERIGAFDLVVDALGGALRSHPPARRTVLAYGALWTNVHGRRALGSVNALEQRYWRASRMAGVLPIGRRSADGRPPEAAFFWSLKRMDVVRWRERGVDAWKEDVSTLWPEAATLLHGVTPARI